jgi:hypothetical protein
MDTAVQKHYYGYGSVIGVRESFRVQLSLGTRRERTQWLYVCSKSCNQELCYRTDRVRTCVIEL